MGAARRRPRGRILAAIAAGHTAPAIARHFGVTEQAVYNAARRAGRSVTRCAGHPAARSGVAVTARGLAAIRAYERAHQLPPAIGG